MSAQVSMSADGRTVTVSGADRKAARKLAMRAAGTVAIGTPTEADGAYVWHVSERALAARKVVPATVPASAVKAPAKARKAPDASELLTLALAGDHAARELLLAALGATPDTAPAKAPAKAERELPAFLQRPPVTCETCRDLGVVRSVGKRAGQPYRTADGAAAAKAAGRAVKCPSHKRAAKTA